VRCASLHRAHLRGQPLRPALLIGLSHLPRTEQLPDLSPVIVSGPRGKRVLSQELGRDLRQSGDVLDCAVRKLTKCRGKAALDLVELQHQCEAEPGGTDFVAQLAEIVANQRPAVDELFFGPLLPQNRLDLLTGRHRHEAGPGQRKACRAAQTPCSQSSRESPNRATFKLLTGHFASGRSFGSSGPPTHARHYRNTDNGNPAIARRCRARRRDTEST